MTSAARPTDNNADAWNLWLEEHADSGNAYKAVQIAEALDASEKRSQLLDRLQATRFLWIDAEHSVCVGGRFDGWLMWKHPDGQWVSVRKLVQERTTTPEASMHTALTFIERKHTVKSSDEQKSNSVPAGAGPLLKPVDLCLPWRKHTAEDEHLTDEIDFSPSGSATFRFLFDRHDELVAIVAVEDTSDGAAAELAARVNLFLAAPDLLEACEDGLHALKMDAAHRSEIETLEAAIRKAEA